MKKSRHLIKAAGALFYAANTQRYLFLLRAGDAYKLTWGIVGGKANDNESINDCLQREIQEEVGTIPPINKVIPIDLYTSNDRKFEYHTFVYVVDDEFIPTLNEEHTGWCWTTLEGLPKPLHPGLFSSISINELKNKLVSIGQLYANVS